MGPTFYRYAFISPLNLQEIVSQSAIDLLEPRIHELVAVKYGNLSALYSNKFFSRLISSSLVYLAVGWVGYGAGGKTLGGYP